MEVVEKAETKPSKPPTPKDKNKPHTTVRFQLHLAESTDRSFPEFSYLQLLGGSTKVSRCTSAIVDILG